MRPLNVGKKNSTVVLVSNQIHFFHVVYIIYLKKKNHLAAAAVITTEPFLLTNLILGQMKTRLRPKLNRAVATDLGKGNKRAISPSH